MVIAHNLQAMNTARQYGINTERSSKITEKLASGYRINRAADDAAGLSISEKMRKQIRGLTQASKNAEDGISLVQIADGAMSEIHEMLDRGYELSVKAANETLSVSDKRDIQKEIEQLKSEIDGIRERTKYNEIYVLKGKEIDTGRVNKVKKEWKEVPIGVEISEAFGNEFLTDSFDTTEKYNSSLGGIKTATVTHPAASIDFTLSSPGDLIGWGFYVTCCTCDSYYSFKFVEGNSVTRSEFPNPDPAITFPCETYEIGVDGVLDAKELVEKILEATASPSDSSLKGWPNDHYTRFVADPDKPGKLWLYDMRKVKGTKVPDDLASQNDWIAELPGKGTEFSMDADVDPRGKVGIGVFQKDNSPIMEEIPQNITLQIGADSTDKMTLRLPWISSKLLGIEDVNVCRKKGADQAMDSFSDAKEIVSSHRSRLGAYQNRLEHTVRNLDNVVENTTAAESQIRDTDMAKLLVQNSILNILLQAGQSMLAQANQSKQGILNLVS